MPSIVTQEIRIQIARHEKTGLLMATSDDMPRLMVAAVDGDELKACVPLVIRDMLEAEGKTVHSVEAAPDHDDLPAGFVAGHILASAKLEAAQVTPDEYRAAIRNMALTPVRPSSGKHSLHRWRVGELYPIRDPDTLSSEEREAAMDFYRVQFDRPAH